MKTREEAVVFVQNQFGDDATRLNKNSRLHYGKQELKALLDFIYQAEPDSPEQELIMDTSREN